MLALVLAVPLGMTVWLGQQTPPAGRVLVIAPPWQPDAEVIGRLGALGAGWALPLWVPGAWLAEFGREGAGGPVRGLMVFGLVDGSTWLGGCAALPPRQAPRPEDAGAAS
jgi:hypothetical protein